MKNRRQFDLVIFGADPGGFAAAACAARAGAVCAVVKTGHELMGAGSASTVPNFVWRQLDLHETDLVVEPIEARVSLLPDGGAVASFADDQRTEDELSKASPNDGALWADFKGEMRRKHARKKLPREEIFAALGATFAATPMDGAPTDTLDAVLDDYFDSDAIKTHLAAVAGLAFGLGGEEPGSAYALASAVDRNAWRVKDGAGLLATLERVSEKAGVEHYDARARRIVRHDARHFDVELENAEILRAGALMASSPRIAWALGLKIKGDPSPLSNRENAEAMISVKLSQEILPPASAPEGVAATYYIMESAEEIRAARDAVLEGRIPDVAPISFELGDREILVRTSYCPKVLVSEDGPREWTGQDRQILGKQVVQRLERYLNGALDSVQRTDVKICGAADLEPEFALNDDAPAIAAPPPEVNEIAAAARLAMRLVANG